MVAQIIGVGQSLIEPGALEQRKELVERELYEYGIEVTSYIAVGTNVQQLRTAVANALKEASMLIVLGGLGISPDDVSKDIVCEALELRLVLHAQTMQRVREAYARANRPMPPQAKKLAMLPERSVVFPGAQGITPGCAISQDGQFILLLPEAEEELASMLGHSVLAYLSKFSHSAALTRTVNVYGMSPEVVTQRLTKIMQNKNPLVEVVPATGEVTVRVTARGTTKAMTGVLCSSTIQQIMNELGDAAYGTDQPGLAAAAISLLDRYGKTVAVCECATGGLFSSIVGDCNPELMKHSTAPRFADAKAHPLRGVRSTIKKFGGVSPQAATAMAYSFMKQYDSDFGIGITGSFGSSHDSNKSQTGLYYVAVCDKDNLWIDKIEMPRGTPVADLQSGAVLMAYFMVARVLNALPGTADGFVSLSAALAGKFPPGIAPAKKRGLFSALFPAKGDSSGTTARKLVVLAAVLVLIGSGSFLGTHYYQSHTNRKLHAELAALYVRPDSALVENYPAGYQPDFTSLYAINEDVAGWLRIDGTQINYPVVHSDGYEAKNFYGKTSRYGALQLSLQSSVEPQSRSYIISGSNPSDGQMLAALTDYKSLEFARAHALITFDDVYRDNEYAVFAVLFADASEGSGDNFAHSMPISFGSPEAFDSFIGEVRERSFYTSELDVSSGDQFLVLSTDSREFNGARIVVMARRVHAGEVLSHSSFDWNETAKFPDTWYKLDAKKQASLAPYSAGGPAVAAIASADGAPSSGSSSSDSDADRSASEEAARSASEEAARSASEEAARSASEEAARSASEEAARSASEEAARSASEEAARSASEEAARSASEEAARSASEAAARSASEAAARSASEAAASLAALSSASSSNPLAIYDYETVTPSPNKPSGGSSSGSHGVWADTLSIVSNGRTITGNAADIVAQVLMNETNGSFHKEALKAQALAAYTFIRQQNAAGITPYLGAKTPNAACISAVAAVEGEAVYYNGSLAFTPFFATSAGVTSASKDVWGGHYDYLVSVDSSVDENAPGFKRTVTMSASEVAQRVYDYFGTDPYDYSSNPARWFTIRSYADDGVYIKSIQVGKKTTTGRILRENVLNLRSAAFDVSYSESGKYFTFTTYGYGHGVGLSQNGANLYAQQGWSYEQILEHYYPGTYVD